VDLLLIHIIILYQHLTILSHIPIVILDIKMPAMNGFELYKEIKKKDPNTKICFLTAAEEYYEELRKEEEYCALDKNLFIQKPISNEEIIREINK
jgi:CheY-like chemotaxis protein